MRISPLNLISTPIAVLNSVGLNLRVGLSSEDPMVGRNPSETYAAYLSVYSPGGVLLERQHLGDRSHLQGFAYRLDIGDSVGAAAIEHQHRRSQRDGNIQGEPLGGATAGQGQEQEQDDPDGSCFERLQGRGPRQGTERGWGGTADRSDWGPGTQAGPCRKSHSMGP